MKDLVKAQKEYIKFLSDEYDKLASFGAVHDWNWSQEIIDEEIRLRKRIDDLENKYKILSPDLHQEVSEKNFHQMKLDVEGIVLSTDEQKGKISC